jgi:hypothetical protein
MADCCIDYLAYRRDRFAEAMGGQRGQTEPPERLSLESPPIPGVDPNELLDLLIFLAVAGLALYLSVIFRLADRIWRKPWILFIAATIFILVDLAFRADRPRPAWFGIPTGLAFLMIIMGTYMRIRPRREKRA